MIMEIFCQNHSLVQENMYCKSSQSGMRSSTLARNCVQHIGETRVFEAITQSESYIIVLFHLQIFENNGSILLMKN